MILLKLIPKFLFFIVLGSILLSGCPYDRAYGPPVILNFKEPIHIEVHYSDLKIVKSEIVHKEFSFLGRMDAEFVKLVIFSSEEIIFEFIAKDFEFSEKLRDYKNDPLFFWNIDEHGKRPSLISDSPKKKEIKMILEE